MKPEVDKETKEKLLSTRSSLQDVVRMEEKICDDIAILLRGRRSLRPGQSEYGRYRELLDARDKCREEIKSLKIKLRAIMKPLQKEEYGHEYALREGSGGDPLKLRSSPMRSKISGKAIRVNAPDDA